MPTRQAETRTQTLRRRLGAWAALALAGVIAALTSAAVVEERSLVLDLQRANGESLLSHLAAMPVFREDSDTARRHVPATVHEHWMLGGQRRSWLRRESRI